MQQPEIDDIRWLTSEQAADYFAAAEDPSAATHTVVARLRNWLSPQQTHLVMQQVELRRKGAKKFPLAEKMFFTPKGLQQATDYWTASYKATRFPKRRPVVDLCCGIGGDTIALAERGRLVGVERDPVAAHFAVSNAKACGAACAIWAEEISPGSLTDAAAWHIDPDRRPQGKRTTQPDFYQPTMETIDALRAENANAAVKVAPAATLPARWCSESEREWISRAGECRQQIAWFGDLARHAGRVRATLLSRQGRVLASIHGAQDVAIPQTDSVQKYIAEMDSAVLAAQLAGVIAEQNDLKQFASTHAMLTAQGPSQEKVLTWFEVVEAMPYQVKRVKKLLMDHKVSDLEVKTRGVALDPAEVKKQVSPARGTVANRAVLILLRSDNQTLAILASRLA